MAKLTIEQVKKELSANGYTLKKEEYKNLKTPIELECNLGHFLTMSLHQVRRGERCPVCERIKTNKINVKMEKKEKGVLRIMALDQSTTETGFSVFDNAELVHSGSIALPGDEPMDRIVYLVEWVMSCIKNWNIDQVAIEDIQLQFFKGKGNNESAQVKTYKTLAHLQGALLFMCHQLSINCHVIHVSTWRAHAGITAKTRHDAKVSAKKKMEAKYDRVFSVDEAEAICIGAYVAEKHIKNNTMYSW